MTNTRPLATKWTKVFTFITVALAVAGLAVGSGMLRVQASEAQDFVTAEKVSVGNTFISIITTDGEVYSRGWNSQGQLGVEAGSTVEVSDWEKIPMDRTVKDLQTTDHTVALAEDGTIWSWGEGSQGQIGNGQQNTAFTPTQVTATARYDSITATANSVAALDSNGRLWTWGANDAGQLGDGTTEARVQPTVVPTEKRFTQVFGGKGSVYALDADKRLWAWGANNAGQLGNGNTDTATEPVRVGENTWDVIATNIQSDTVLGVDSNGWLHSWGANANGELGTGTDWREEQRLENERVEREIEAVKAADAQRKAGLIETCVAEKETADEEKAEADRKKKQDAADRKYERELAEYEEAVEEEEETGDESDPPLERPEREVIESTYEAPASLQDSTYYADCVEDVEEDFEETDTSDMKPRTIPEPELKGNVSVPTIVTNNFQFTTAAVGSENAYAVDVLGRLYGWGSDNQGQSGIGLNEDTHTQVPVEISNNITSVTAGNKYAAALNNDKQLFMWGVNTDSVLLSKTSDRKELLSPTVKGQDWDRIIAGPTTMYGWQSNTSYAWGSNKNAELGSESESETAVTPNELPLKTQTIAPYANGAVSLGLSNQFIFWGGNSNGEHGVEASEELVRPATNRTVDTFSDVAVGNRTSYAVDNGGQLWGWGYNSEKLVDPNDTNGKLPYPVVLPYAEATHITSGVSVAAVVDNQRLSVWKSDGSTTSYDLDGVEVTDLQAGKDFIAVLTADGKVLTVGGSVFSEEDSLTEVEEFAGQEITQISASEELLFGVTSAGTVVGAGNDPHEILESNNDEDITHISTNGQIAVIVNSKGIVWGWGHNPYYALGTDLRYSNPHVLPLTITEEEN